MSGPDVLTFGCRLNTCKSEVMRGPARGLEELVIVNTRAVTVEAERQARHAIRRSHHDRPGARMVVTGCAALLDPATWTGLLGGGAGGRQRGQGGARHWKCRVRHHGRAGYGGAPPHAGRSRAFMQVRQVCDHRCTFCIIPFGRCPGRSMSIGTVVEQARTLTRTGCQEVVLTGVDVIAYGEDLPGRPALGQAVRRLLALKLRRLLLSSLDPVEIDDDLWRLIADEPRLVPHLHLSLQAGFDPVLERMKRRHGVADAARVVECARRLRPGIGVGADLIAGFPTEGEASFAKTLDFGNDQGLLYLYVFPCSERPGTLAARMPAVPPALRRERAARLREVGAATTRALRQALVGGRLRVLSETPTSGRSEQFAPVRFTAEAGRPGEAVAAHAVAADAHGLRGTRI